MRSIFDCKAFYRRVFSRCSGDGGLMLPETSPWLFALAEAFKEFSTASLCEL
jgi:hypothetical protein